MSALRRLTGLQINQGKSACFSRGYNLEGCPWRRRAGVPVGTVALAGVDGPKNAPAHSNAVMAGQGGARILGPTRRARECAAVDAPTYRPVCSRSGGPLRARSRDR